MTHQAPTKLFNKNFFLLWQGQFVSMLGSSVFMFTLIFTVKNGTESAPLVGILMMAHALATLLTSPFAGTIADRHSRKNIIVICDFLSFICVLSLALMMYWLPEDIKTWSPIEQNLFISYLFFIAIVLGVIGGFFRPAVSAAIPDLVPKDKLAAANSWNLSTMQLTAMLGNLVAGTVYIVLGAPLILLIDAFSYLFSAISELFITIPQPKKTEKAEVVGQTAMQKFLDETMDGVRYLSSKVGMKEFVIMAALINFFSAPLIMLLPFYVEDHLGLDAAWYGYLLAVAGIGALFGFGLAAMLKVTGMKRVIAITIAFVFMALCVVGSGLTQNYIIAMAGMFLIGSCVAFFNVITITLVQQHTKGEIRGRVVGLLSTMIGVVTPISMGLSGFVFEWVDKSIPVIYISTGVIFVLLSTYIFVSPTYRGFFMLDPEEDDMEADEIDAETAENLAEVTASTKGTG
jgi:MFS transporter, DHA3 family, macrolide efflux protein